MNKKLTITTLILLASLGLVVSGCLKKEPETNTNVNTGQNQNANTNQQAEEIDTSNWETYKNEEYGFEFKYPEGWDIIDSNDKISVYYKGWRRGLPEGGSGLDIEIGEITINKFIEDYNKSDISDGVSLSQITDQKDYIFNNIATTKLIGSTAMGIDRNFLFIRHNNKSYVISFHDFDKYHVLILSSFKFTN